MSELQFQKAAVLGATGPTGRVIAAALHDRDLLVRVVSRSMSNLQRAFPESAYEPHDADLLDPDAARRAINGCDLIVDCIGLPLDRFEEHVPITRSIVDAARTTGARCVAIGGFWSYQSLSEEPLPESAPRNPTTRLGRIRREQEDILLDAGAAIAALPDFYGPGVTNSSAAAAMIPFLQGKRAKWIGAVDHPRDFIYIPDLGEPICRLAMREEAYGQRWHLTGAGPITPCRFTEIAAEHLGREPALLVGKKPVLTLMGLFNADLRRFLDVYHLYAGPAVFDDSRLRALIDDYPTTSYEQGVPAFVDWLAKHSRRSD